MTAIILDGRATAAEIKADLTARVAALRERGVTPGLGTVLIGNDPSSHAYVAGKHRDCAEVGIASIQRELPASASQADVEAVVRELNADPACTGYIVQLPLPKGLDEFAVLELMDPEQGRRRPAPEQPRAARAHAPGPQPCTPRGCVELLRRYDVPIDGAEVVVVGRGVTVGRPLGLLLTRRSENATVTLCHTGTKDLASHVQRADIVVAAAGVPGLISARHGAAGRRRARRRQHEGRRRRREGSVRRRRRPGRGEVAGWLAPMPGGVGPMTRAMLLTNVVEAAEGRLNCAA